MLPTKRILATALLAFASPLFAGDATSANQLLADSIAQRLRSAEQLRHYRIDIQTAGNIATLSGTVTTNAQLQDVLNMVRTTPGVVAVENHIVVRQPEPLVPVAYRAQSPLKLTPVSNQDEYAAPGGSELAEPGHVAEPAPIQEFPGGVAPYSDAPVMPPYSWPAYTPYNNFASMAYQTQYPAGAWPFIGPPYPYPMIPSGWRHVSLRWKKGYWFLKFHSH